MILSFKTKINGKPTYFPEKIWSGLGDVCNKYNYCIDEFHTGLMNVGFDDQRDHKPKLHTIRKDDKNRWKPGMMIDFFINARQKDMFRFAPRIPVVSIQYIGILHYRDNSEVNIDGRYLFPSEVEKLAKNDGFESVDDFFQYFNEDYNGIIIHWTNLKY
ncbi:hypothetical protein [Chryseobacterium salviniae]|uniref:Uncharacterized protein n=1 Tax=Chryseobacterium salviniae TaxID=3101750 RepID=A0ABU6HSD1_9FLAO|nr:hypothetical protein [Chryseobacterium sp. T9W2-O]MEC3875960.1 hypothetical protein [Chryseobacterium sp. T9W2-O]